MLFIRRGGARSWVWVVWLAPASYCMGGRAFGTIVLPGKWQHALSHRCLWSGCTFVASSTILVCILCLCAMHLPAVLVTPSTAHYTQRLRAPHEFGHVKGGLVGQGGEGGRF